MSQRAEQETPQKVRESGCWWWMLFVLFIATAIGCAVSFKIFDALITMMIGIWIYYMAKDHCKQMSQQCLFSFGFMCVIQAVFEFIFLAMSLPGRRTQSTTQAPGNSHSAPNPFGGGAHSSSYTVTTKTTPFFSEEQGWHYNFQSGMMIASCVVFIIGALMARSFYAEYPDSLFDDEEEGRAIGGSSAYSGGGGRYYGGGGAARPATGNSLGGGRSGSAGAPGALFGGSGQRLG